MTATITPTMTFFFVVHLSNIDRERKKREKTRIFYFVLLGICLNCFDRFVLLTEVVRCVRRTELADETA